MHLNTDFSTLFRGLLRLSAGLLMATAFLPLMAQTVVEIPQEILDAHAQSAHHGGGRKAEIDRTRNEIISHWFRHRLFLEKKDIENSDSALASIKELSTKTSVDESITIGRALLYQGFQFLEIADPDSALHSFGKALEFDPSLYSAHIGKAKAHYFKNPAGVFSYSLDIFRAIAGRFKNFWSLYYFGTNTLIVIYLTLGIWAILTIFIGVLKCWKSVLHEMKERFSKRLGKVLGIAAGFAVMFLPAFLWLGPLWLFLFWSILFWKYWSVPHRFAVGVFLAQLILFIPGMYFFQQLTLSGTDPYVQATVSAVTGDYDEDRIILLKELYQKYPNNASAAFTLGVLYKNGGYSEESMKYFKLSIKSRPAFVEAIINLGNRHFESQRTYEAIRYYKQSISIRPTVEAYYNMSKAYNLVFEFQQAEEAMDEATLIDATLAAELTNENKPVADAYPGFKEVVSEFVNVSHSGFAEAASTIISWKTFINPFAFLALLTLIGIVLYSRLTEDSPRAIVCVKCGRSYCDDCRIGLETESLCSQCSHLFIKKEGMSPSTRSRKLYEVERHARRKTISLGLLDIVLPGGGLVYSERLGLGLTALLLVGAAGACLLSRPWLMGDPGAIVASLHILPITIASILFGLAWFIANPLKWFIR